MHSGSFVIKIKDSNKNLKSSSFGYLQDFFAKIEGIDRALLGHGSVTIKVRHYLDNPFYCDGIWTLRVLVDLEFKEGSFEFIPEEILCNLHGYLDQCRSTIIYDLFRSKNTDQLDEAVSVISGHAKVLSESLKQSFVPNSSRILRNFSDILSRSSRNHGHYNFGYQTEIEEGVDSESTQFVGISNRLKDVLQNDEAIEGEPYEKSLLIAQPHFINKDAKWTFSMPDGNLSCYVRDYEWINRYFKGEENPGPGCSLNVTLKNGPVGYRGKIEPYIIKVHRIVKPLSPQMSLSL